MPTTPPLRSRGRCQVWAAEPGARPLRLRRVRPAPPRQVRPTPSLGATFSCVPASAIRRSAPRPAGGLPGPGRVAEPCWASRDRVGRQLRRRTRQKPEKGGLRGPGRLQVLSRGEAAPEGAGLQGACAALPAPARDTPATVAGSGPGARRGPQLMALLCEPRRGRALLALLASLLLSGAQALSRDLDVHGEGQERESGSGGLGEAAAEVGYSVRRGSLRVVRAGSGAGPAGKVRDTSEHTSAEAEGLAKCPLEKEGGREGDEVY